MWDIQHPTEEKWYGIFGWRDRKSAMGFVHKGDAEAYADRTGLPKDVRIEKRPEEREPGVDADFNPFKAPR